MKLKKLLKSAWLLPFIIFITIFVYILNDEYNFYSRYTHNEDSFLAWVDWGDLIVPALSISIPVMLIILLFKRFNWKKVLVGLILFFSISWSLINFYYSIKIQDTPIDWFLSFGKVYEGGACSCPATAGWVIKKCIYKSQGDDIKKILAADASADCSMFGCAPATLYKYCD